jgi:hypothetical protein
MNGRRAHFYSSSRRLAEGVEELVRSLGGSAKITSKKTTHLDAYNVRVTMDDVTGWCPFRLRRKAKQWAEGRAAVAAVQRRRPVRRVVSVTEVGVREAQCITVANADGLYVADGYVLTHNSWSIAWSALAEWRAGRSPAVYSLELSPEVMLDRIACLAAVVNSGRWDRGDALPEEVERVEHWKAQLSDSPPLWILQPSIGSRTLPYMVRDAQVREADSIILDQLTFVELPSPRKAKNERIGEALHEFRAELGSGNRPLSALVAHQINRDGHSRSLKNGYLQMDDMADSSECERTADASFAIYQGRDHIRMGMAMLQTLSARRFANKHWMIDWQPFQNLVGVRSEVELEGDS